MVKVMGQRSSLSRTYMFLLSILMINITRVCRGALVLANWGWITFRRTLQLSLLKVRISCEWGGLDHPDTYPRKWKKKWDFFCGRGILDYPSSVSPSVRQSVSPSACPLDLNNFKGLLAAKVLSDLVCNRPCAFSGRSFFYLFIFFPCIWHVMYMYLYYA